MKSIRKVTIFILLIILTSGSLVLGQTCILDSFNINKFTYNQFGKVTQITFAANCNPGGIACTVYRDLKYIGDTTLKSVIQYDISYIGDTLHGPDTIMRYKFTNGLLSQIRDGDFCIYDDFVWNNNKVTELKYYYLVNDTVDSTQTRVLYFTYINDNISNMLYYKLSGPLIDNVNYQYDNKYNPFYFSEITLVDGDIVKYACRNNWISDSHLNTRTFYYNQYDYPLTIISNFYGNTYFDTLVYNCLTSIHETENPENNLEIFPNPATDQIIVKVPLSTSEEIISIYNIQGQSLLQQIIQQDKTEIDFSNFDKGVYIVRVFGADINVVKKIIKE
jgi:hypothetical protein